MARDHARRSSGRTHQRLITDVFDEQTRTLRVQYPVWLIVAIALAGVVAFALVGFYGYRDASPEPAITRQLFHEPWPLFLWFCALIMALQATVLRDRSLRRQLVASLLMTFISMVIVGAAYYYGRQIDQAIQYAVERILSIRQFVPELGNSPWFYALINFGVLAVFWADTLRRWGLAAMGKPLRPAPLDLGAQRETKATEQPTLDELVSGDLIAAALLSLVLALVFRTGVINFLTNALQVGVQVNTCVLSWPVGKCVPLGGGPHDPPTLFFLDLIQSLIYLPLGLLILALSATLSGMAVGGGVRETAAPHPTVVMSATDSNSATGSVAEEVALTVLSTLRSALNRRMRVAADNMGISLRSVAWPLFVLIGVVAAATSAREIQQYLHLLSDMHTCSTSACADYAAVQALLAGGQTYIAGAIGLLFGVVCVLSIVVSLGLLVFSQHAALNTLRFTALVGFIGLMTFWIFSLALSGFNELLWLMHAASRWPFPQPGVATITSFAVLFIFGVMLAVRRVRGPETRSPLGGGGEPALAGLLADPIGQSSDGTGV